MIKVGLEGVLVIPKLRCWRVGFVMSHLHHFMLWLWYHIRMLNHGFEIVSSITKASNVGPHEKVALEYIETYSLSGAPRLAQPNPKELVGFVSFLFWIAIELILPKVCRKQGTNREIVECQGDNDGTIQRVTP
jgi:hypothetical protein